MCWQSYFLRSISLLPLFGISGKEEKKGGLKRTGMDKRMWTLINDVLPIFFFLVITISWLKAILDSDGKCHMDICDKCMWGEYCPDRH